MSVVSGEGRASTRVSVDFSHAPNPGQKGGCEGKGRGRMTEFREVGEGGGTEEWVIWEGLERERRENGRDEMMGRYSRGGGIGREERRYEGMRWNE